VDVGYGETRCRAPRRVAHADIGGSACGDPPPGGRGAIGPVAVSRDQTTLP